MHSEWVTRKSNGTPFYFSSETSSSVIIKSLSQGKICGKLFSTCSVSNMYLWAAFYVSDTLSYHLRLRRLKTEMKWGASLVVQWLRICLPMQKVQIWYLVQWFRIHLVVKIPHASRQPKPVHNCWAPALEPVLHNYRAWAPRAHSKRHNHNKKPMHCL